MSHFEDSIELNVPIERAWELISNPEALPDIQPDTTVKLLSGAWTEVGSKHLVSQRVGRTWVDQVHEITRLEAPHLLEERATWRGSTAMSQAELRSLGPASCQLIMRAEVEYGSSLGELVARLSSPFAGRQRRRWMRQLKVAIEEHAAAGDA